MCLLQFTYLFDQFTYLFDKNAAERCACCRLLTYYFHFTMRDTTGPFPLQLYPTQKVRCFPQMNTCDGVECGWVRRSVRQACATEYLCVHHVSHCTLCPFLFLAYSVSVVSISISLALSLSIVLSMSFSLPQNRVFLRAEVGLSLFLSPCLSLSLSLSRSLFFSLGNRTSNSLILSPNPHPTLSLSLSPMRLCWTSAPFADSCDIQFNFDGQKIRSRVCCDTTV